MANMQEFARYAHQAKANASRFVLDLYQGTRYLPKLLGIRPPRSGILIMHGEEHLSPHEHWN